MKEGFWVEIRARLAALLDLAFEGLCIRMISRRTYNKRMKCRPTDEGSAA
jgi:hypothetical protein